MFRFHGRSADCIACRTASSTGHRSPSQQCWCVDLIGILLFSAHGHEETVQNAVTLSGGQQELDNTPPVHVRTLASATQIAAAIEEGVNTFMETVPALIKVLDEVAKVYPFISGTDESASKTCVFTSHVISCCPRIQGRLHPRSKA